MNHDRDSANEISNAYEKIFQAQKEIYKEIVKILVDSILLDEGTKPEPDKTKL